jgi:hypothetical protein
MPFPDLSVEVIFVFSSSEDISHVLVIKLNRLFFIQRKRLLDNTEMLDRTTRRLDHGYKVTLETG